jgi:hypothetical protein
VITITISVSLWHGTMVTFAETGAVVVTRPTKLDREPTDALVETVI